MVDQAKETETPAASSGRRKNVVMLGVLAGVMIVEALVVFVLVKSFAGAPATAQAAEGLVATEGEKAPGQVELKVGEFRAQNRTGQQSYMLQFSLFATVSEPDKAKAEEILAGKSATIKDRFSRVVRSMDPERFLEPDLTTLRTQLKAELSQVMGPDLKIHEVLLTDFTSAVDN
ncbi:MAG TPA: flagellar basal body-associated FliL family protein [Phycisphaerae bacterium]|nr:flagellar basal body-associated FliL family protein [Phycisphaerae bacterium]HOJ74302.1 flagellar basal body-associated FliL family protein [Phycisphaerae bacterium]HOM51381.1 flagellar basal body-associated FliL family protein [Phycisphaerae bacterium]HON67125.1 flagellar basal body-associated FliL family protein [Phycisphaerae bacterium]HOQ84988.1 flagellar basal body-associated FliL family protein [Phycisphaerae bacterium]